MELASKAEGSIGGLCPEPVDSGADSGDRGSQSVEMSHAHIAGELLSGVEESTHVRPGVRKLCDPILRGEICHR